MKSILILVGNLNSSGGTERVSSLVANGLSGKGYNVVITSISGGDRPFFSLNSKVKVRTLFNIPGRTLYRTPKIVARVRKILKEESIDTLITVETMSVLFTLPALIGLSVKHICWEHFNFNNDLGKKGRRIARQLAARYCDAVVTLTERDKEYWLQGTKHKNQIISIPNPSPFTVQGNTYSKNSKIVLAVGRLVNIKGYDLLLKAWSKVVQDAPDWQLKIVGEGEERASLTKFIEDNNLSSCVELVGSTKDVQKYYSDAAIFCLSSRFEGFPMVLLEALSFGLPVISFDCDTGPAEILEGTGSVLVEPYNIKLFVEGINTLIEDADLRERISMSSRRKAELYQLENIIKEWDKLIVNMPDTKK